MKNYNEFWKEREVSHCAHPSVRFRNYLIIKTVRQILNSAKNKSIVDIGCGNGDLLSQLNERLRLDGTQVSLSGYDVSEYQIEKNRAKGLPIDFRAADFNKKVELNNQFSVVISSELIEHLENWRLSLENIAKMNEPGGYLILTTQSGKRFKSDESLGHVRHFELDFLTDYLKTLNYKIINAERRGFPFYNLQKIVNSIILSISTKVAHTETNKLTSVLFKITYLLFRISIKSKRLGPQIFILAHKLS